MDSLAPSKPDALIAMLAATTLKEKNAKPILIFNITEEDLYKYPGITITTIFLNIISMTHQYSLITQTKSLPHKKHAGLQQFGFG